MTAMAQIEGNLTADPELRFTPSGVAVCEFSVAVNRRWTNAANETVEEVSFFDVTSWKDLADNVAMSLHKGDRVQVEGRLEQLRWEDKDGNKRNKIRIVANAVGTSLRFATVDITKNPRQGGSNTPPDEIALAGADAGKAPAMAAAAPDDGTEPF